tara:strand:+ start:478 stop:648 length:171 start_codon:yes stop_codon:yes gene_type:complete
MLCEKYENMMEKEHDCLLLSMLKDHDASENIQKLAPIVVNIEAMGSPEREIIFSLN